MPKFQVEYTVEINDVDERLAINTAQAFVRQAISFGFKEPGQWSAFPVGGGKIYYEGEEYEQVRD